MKNEIYDIAIAFIMDKDTQADAYISNDDILYTFTKRGLADYPYCLIISATCKAPYKIGTYPKMKYKGHISLQRGTSLNPQHSLLDERTKHEVGSALDKTQCDLKRFITRVRSPKFFKTLDMAEKRITGKIQTTDNSAQLFNIIYRLKENQK
ncbi:MAG: hypothetical protein IJX89_03420 [Alphaproteobacteria bacterium]|nr:hypothetical protein [Alphaproteobacteria bacterium]